MRKKQKIKQTRKACPKQLHFEKKLRKQIVIDVQIPCSTRLRLIPSIFHSEPEVAEFWFTNTQTKTRAHSLGVCVCVATTNSIDLQRINNSASLCVVPVCVCGFSDFRTCVKAQEHTETNDLIKKTDKLCDSTDENKWIIVHARTHADSKRKLKNFCSIGKIIANNSILNTWFSGEFMGRGGWGDTKQTNMIADLFGYLLIGSLFEQLTMICMCVKLLIGHHLKEGGEGVVLLIKWFICSEFVGLYIYIWKTGQIFSCSVLLTN